MSVADWPGIAAKLAAHPVTAVKDAVLAASGRAKQALEQRTLQKLSGPDDCWVSEDGLSPYGSQHMTPADAAASGLVPRSTWKPARMRRRKKPTNELEDTSQRTGAWFPHDGYEGGQREPPSRFGLAPRRGPRFPDRW